MFFRRCFSFTGSFVANLGGIEAGCRIGESFIGLVNPSTPANILAIGLTGTLITCIPSIALSLRLLMKYQDDPFKAISSQFLLGVSTGILCKFVNAAILSAFVATAANPFTLPFLIAVGASALCVMSLYWISRPSSSELNAQAFQNEPFFDGSAPAPEPEEFKAFSGKPYRLSDFS